MNKAGMFKTPISPIVVVDQLPISQVPILLGLVVAAGKRASMRHSKFYPYRRKPFNAYARSKSSLPTLCSSPAGEGRYPAQFVDVFWNRADDRRVRDLEVVFIPRGSDELPSPSEDREFWSAYASYNKTWFADLGNCCSNWLTSKGLFPEGIFGQLLYSGFVNKAELRRALEEFGHIEECAWARDMLRGFGDDE